MVDDLQVRAPMDPYTRPHESELVAAVQGHHEAAHQAL
jgi:hypothetical protein